MEVRLRRPLVVATLAGGLLLAGCSQRRHRQADAAPDGADAGDMTSVDAAPGADASPVGDASPDGVACNPVTQQGCAVGQKCSWIVTRVSPTFLARTDCVRDGNVDLGGACIDTCIPQGSTDIGAPCGEENAPDETANPPIIGTDDCVAGGVCIDGACKAICQGDSCGAEQACVGYGDLFTDAEDVGACSFECDPLLQDCGDGRGCYIDPFPGNGYATCEDELHPDRLQGVACPDDDCSINGCAAGYGPWLVGIDSALCTAISGAVDTYLDDPDGDGTGTLIGNPLGLPGADCSEERTGVAGLQSYSLQSFYSNTQDTPAAWGICAPSGIDNGDCAQFSVGFLFATYDAAEADPEPPTGDEALAELCATTERCGFACVSNATFDELVTEYCDAHAGSPACAP